MSGLSARNHGSQASLSASDLSHPPNTKRMGSSRFGRRTKRSQHNAEASQESASMQPSFSGGASNSQSSYTTRPLSPGMNPYSMAGRHPPPMGSMPSGKKFTQMEPTHLSIDQIKMIQMELDRLSLERTQLETEVLLRQKQVKMGAVSDCITYDKRFFCFWLN